LNIREINIHPVTINELIARHVLEWKKGAYDFYWVKPKPDNNYDEQTGYACIPSMGDEFFEPWEDDHQALMIINNHVSDYEIDKSISQEPYNEKYKVAVYTDPDRHFNAKPNGKGLDNTFSKAICKALLGIVSNKSKQYEVLSGDGIFQEVETQQLEINDKNE
jgi:hypothetical protein